MTGPVHLIRVSRRHAFLRLAASALAWLATSLLAADGQSNPQTNASLPAPSPGLKRPANTGDGACASCHTEKVASYHQTAHYLTSNLATTNSIHGKFSPGFNLLSTADTNLFFEMQAAADGFFQKAVRRVSPTTVGHRMERFDIVLGSGRKGQTYAFWKGDQLFQLPVSYWTELDQWVNSPGYPDGVAIFTRPITPRCLECHATTFESHPPPDNRYKPGSILFGLTCEKCHGPGGEHVARYRSSLPPRRWEDSAILNPARFSRERQMDACALCHGGGGEPITPSLSFTPGDVLSQFVQFPKREAKERVDVHGSQ